MSVSTTLVPSANFVSPLDLSTIAPPALPIPSCRTREGPFQPELFSIITCAFCFNYVYVDVNVTFDVSRLSLVAGQDIPNAAGTSVVPNMFNESAVKTVCSFLGDSDDCWKWKDCCSQAFKCCEQQLNEGPPINEANGKKSCPRTWDGYHCFKDTPANSKVYFDCPAYVPNADTDEQAFKACEENGTWYKNPKSKQEWTDYEDCHDMSSFKRLHSAGVACNIITIILLVPACFIFLYFQQLRKQHRIRLHLCLMISSLFNCMSMLLWEIIIFRDRLYTFNEGESVIEQNSVACRVLNISTRYTLTANFMWMFIEGFHLHRLLVHAFSAPKSLIPYYAFGFGSPWLLIIVYSIIRGLNDHLNQKCWVNQAGSFEWILYTPILVVLLVNIFFLLRIVFIMIKQLEPHPNEPSHFRRAAKAVGVLVPLFGVQFVLFVYRPQGGAFADTFELMNKVFSNLQGAFIALVFCYFNKEVQTQVKAWFARVADRRGYHTGFSMRGGSFTMSTYHTETTRTRSAPGHGDNGSMIPLRRVGWQEEDDNGVKANNQNQNSSLLGNKTQTVPANGGGTVPAGGGGGINGISGSGELANKSLLADGGVDSK